MYLYFSLSFVIFVIKNLTSSLCLLRGLREPHNQVPIAEVSSIQLEFKYLSYLTDRTVFRDKVEKIMIVIESNDKDGPGLYPSYMDNTHGRFTNSKTFPSLTFFLFLTILSNSKEFLTL